MLDSDKLSTYINNFYGFGNWDSDIWFVGMEEGGGNTLGEVQKRLESWHRTSNNLLDNKTHHERLGLTKFFDRGVLQMTAKLIRFKLSIEDKLSGNPSEETEMIRSIQKNSWGQLDSDNALIDLFPLPSPGEGAWLYKSLEWTDIDYLQSRGTYRETLKESRTKFIRDKIKIHQPKIVVFYSTSYIPYWNQIAESDFNSDKAHKYVQNKNVMRFFTKNDICYVQMPQPSAARANSFWSESGIEIRKHLKLRN